MTKPTTPWQCAKCTSYGNIIPRDTPRARLCRWCADELRQAGLIWCSAGKHGCPLDQFTSASPYMCKACVSDQNAVRREANREQRIAYSRATYQANRAQRIAYNHAYYQANRDQILVQKQQYYQAHREEIKSKVRRHRAAGLPLASIMRARARQQAKRAEYKANEKLARVRRFLRMVRGAR